jgi:hypothetical protein
MKTLISVSVLFLLVALAYLAGAHIAKAQQQTQLDWEILTARTLTLEKIQQQIQPIIKDRDEAAGRLCSAAGLKPAECNINPDTRTVSKLAPKGK